MLKLCTGGTSLSPCSLPSYTCFVPIRTCAQGGYFTLPLLIAIVYVFRTSSYLCAGRVLHSPPAAHSSLTTTTSNQTAMHQRLVGRSIFADIHISCTKTAFTTRPAMASKANISNMTPHNQQCHNEKHLNCDLSTYIDSNAVFGISFCLTYRMLTHTVDDDMFLRRRTTLGASTSSSESSSSRNIFVSDEDVCWESRSRLTK